MSYILDALRRAEAERERGHVPGLHSQPLAAGTPQAAPPPRHRGWVLGLGLGAAALLLGALAWLLAGRQPAAAPAVVAAAPAAAAAPAPASVAPPPPAPPLADDVPPPPKRMFPPAPLPPDPVVPKPPVVAAAPPTAPASPPASAASVQPAPATPAPRAADRVLPFGQLPEDIRRQLPSLPIGGAIYSDNAASRMLIVGGQLLHEGDQAAPGIVLEQIKPKSAVLRWNNVRYEVTF